jgi:membrane-associated protease RseP (regulator of RpoE activity)
LESDIASSTEGFSSQSSGTFVSMGPHSGPDTKPRKTLASVLFGVTVLTTLAAGFLLELEFSALSGEEIMGRIFGLTRNPLGILAGAPYAAAILAFLLSHEMGHYLTCRRYRINASLPYVIPAPPPLMFFGTFGAVIRIKSLFKNRNELFDVGIAGPLLGFLVLVPILAIGVSLSTEFTGFESVDTGLQFGEPFLFKLMVSLFFHGDPTFIRLHPVGWAAWFGMLATSLNLLPVGQLDGGHMVYALFGARVHRVVSYATFAALIGLGFLSWPILGYQVFALLLLFLRFRHPVPYDDSPGLGSGRGWLGLLALVIFVLTFMPIPVEMIEHVGSL